MLGKFFKKKEPTENIGISTEITGNTDGLIQVAYITIEAAGGEISEAIAPKLTIGSEVGDLILTDEGVSPRHCTLLVSKDIISIIDHSSEEGTFLNKKRLDAGRTFIIGPKDVIRVGAVKAHVEFKSVPESFQAEKIPEQKQDQDHIEFPKPPEAGAFELEHNEVQATSELEVDEFELDETEMTNEDEKGRKKPQQDFSMVSANGIALKGQTQIEVNIDKKLIKKKFEVRSQDHEDEPTEKKSVLARFFSKFMIFKKSTKAEPIKINKKNRNKKIKMIKKIKTPASSGILRLVALTLDSIFSLSLHTVLSPIALYSELFATLPTKLEKLVVPFYKEFLAVHLESLIQKADFLGEGIAALKEFESLNYIISLLCLTFVFRVITTLILKVSLGQFLIGIREKKNSFISGRIKGFFREALSIVTFPFIIFDLPALINKRTFKEVITFTRLETPFPLGSSIMILIWIPLSFLIYLASPIFEGLEIKPSVHVDTVSERPVKPWEYIKPSKTEELDLMFDSSESLVALPQFEISIKDGKKYRKSGLKFFNLETGTSLEILKVKENFKMLKILDNYIGENPLAEYYQPKIQSLVRSAALNNKNFKHQIQKAELLSFSTEFRNLVKDTYTLNLENLMDFVVNQGVFFRGHMVFRKDFSSLFEGQIKEITFTNFGNVSGLLFTIENGKNNIYNYLPLTSVSPALYKVSENISNIKLSSITNSLRVSPSVDTKTADAAAVYIDNISKGKKADNLEQVDKILAERFFKIAKLFLEKQLPLKELGSLIARNISSLELDKREQSLLFRKLNEIQDKLNLKDHSYFGISKPKSADE